MDTKKNTCYFHIINTYKTLDDLNQDEMRLGGLRINPTTNISSSVTYINNIKLRKIKEKRNSGKRFTKIKNHQFIMVAKRKDCKYLSYGL
jgi:hypothetical protein